MESERRERVVAGELPLSRSVGRSGRSRFAALDQESLAGLIEAREDLERDILSLADDDQRIDPMVRELSLLKYLILSVRTDDPAFLKYQAKMLDEDTSGTKYERASVDLSCWALEQLAEVYEDRPSV